ncbi:MAG: TIGR01777 family oxidoreductase [Chlamydiota bacterium]
MIGIASHFQIKHSDQMVFDWHFKPAVIGRALPHQEVVFSRTYHRDHFYIKVRWCGPIWIKVAVRYSINFSDRTICLEQIAGSFVKEVYRCSVQSLAGGKAELIEKVTWKLWCPLFQKQLSRRLTHCIAYKNEVIDQDLQLVTKYLPSKKLKVIVTGSSGLIGQALCSFLRFAGHDVWRLVRSSLKKGQVLLWNSVEQRTNSSAFEGFDAVVHLAGENIGRGRWTKSRKERLVSSRVEVTRQLAFFLSQLKTPPKTLVCASAIGFYGDRDDQWVTEQDSPGSREFFLSKLCQDWEQAAQSFSRAGEKCGLGVRVVRARFGVVLSDRGGALQQMIVPFKWGLGGVIGKGSQYMSWIVLEDLVGALYHILMTSSLHGAVNCVSPEPVQQRFFARALAKQLHRWCGPPMPAAIVNLGFGQKGRELLLASTRVKPQRLLDTGYSFYYPTLKEALSHVV